MFDLQENRGTLEGFNIFKSKTLISTLQYIFILEPRSTTVP